MNVNAVESTVRTAAGHEPRRTASMSLPQIVWERAARSPHEIALVELGDDRDLAYTWNDLASRAEQLARRLLHLGVSVGDSVVVQLPNSAGFVITALATLRLGAVCTPVGPGLGQRELRHVLEVTGARILFVPERFRSRRHRVETLAMAASGETAGLRHLVVSRGDRSTWLSGKGPGALEVHDVDSIEAADGAQLPTYPAPNEIAHLLFTSGTTGPAKAVPHRTATLNEAVRLMSRRVGLGPDDRLHIAAPMAHHSGFLYGMWLALLQGQAQVVQPAWDAHRALQAFATWKPTFMLGSTPFLMDLVDRVEAGGVRPDSLHTFVVTGSAVSRPLGQRARAALEVEVCAAWGSTESCMATLSAPTDNPEDVAQTDGRPLEGVQLRVVDQNDRGLPPGREGQLEVSGPLLFEGYLDRPDLTAEAFTPDGWYRTGDLAVIEEGGSLRITGRVKDVINRGGEKVPVGDLEQELLAHPSIHEVALVAMPDDRLGERVCMFAAIRPGAPSITLSAVQDYLNGRKVSKHFWPERLEIVPCLPRNHAGKVQKYLLRRQAAAFA